MRALVMSETFTMRAALLFALLFCASVEASTDVTFWNSNINNRLNQIEVRFVAQDGSGALWFATQEGLTRYNGIRADSFSAANADLGGLQAGEVKALAKSPDGELWVLTNSIQRLDKASLLFQPTVDIGGAMQPTAIAFDTDGLLWIGLEGYVGLYRPSTKSFETIEIPSNSRSDRFGITYTSAVVRLLQLNDGMIGVNSATVFDFRKSQSGNVLITPLVDLQGYTASGVTTAIVANGGLYIGTNLDGLLFVDLASREVNQITQGPGGQDLPSDTITALLADDDGVWIGTPNGLVYTADSGRTFQHHTGFSSGLRSNWIVGR